jgi:hypothetical protein
VELGFSHLLVDQVGAVHTTLQVVLGLQALWVKVMLVVMDMIQAL